MKKKIYKDHLAEMFKGEGLHKDKQKSNYQEFYGNKYKLVFIN